MKAYFTRSVFACIGMLCIMTSTISYATPSITCPESFRTSGFINDLAKLSEAVSWNTSMTVQGVCGNYSQIYEKAGIFDTLLRVYQSNETNQTVFSFRPTRSNPTGAKIHHNRHLSACRFINGSCFGLVNSRFQMAFMDLVSDLDKNFISNISTTHVSTVGHSLGGSLQLFMAVYLKEQHSIQPLYALGFAGPFIGDQVFTETYQEPLKEQLGPNMWQIESMDVTDPSNYDGTVEGYNVNNWEGIPDWGLSPLNPTSRFRPYIPRVDVIKTPVFVQTDDICSLLVSPMTNSYGMHDLRNYRSALVGTDCA